jgi:predicted component of viral defense system (DUF524 family)
MDPEIPQRAVLECRNPQGRSVATIDIVAAPLPAGVSANDGPLLLISSEQARTWGEEPLQLRERCRYEYRLKPLAATSGDLSLLPGRGVQPSRVDAFGEERGLIEPGDYCGMLPLVVIRRGDRQESHLAQGNVEVRSSKLEYRGHYRGMLKCIGDQCAALLLDSRAPTRLRLSTLWRTDARILEQQLEFLRQTLQSATFNGAVDEVLRSPHRRLEEDLEERDISRLRKPDRHFAGQLVVSTRRVRTLADHPLHATVAHLPARITVRCRSDSLDTAENRFAKMVLVEFRDLLVDVGAHLLRLQAQTGNPQNERLLRETQRLRSELEAQLSRGFFPDVSPPTMLPLGSSVLQRKTGYRELLRFWLQFHAGAQLLWTGGPDVFHAGARNVATLYEYWLFFQLEALFRRKFKCEQPLHALLVDRGTAPPQLVLKRGVELRTPVSGIWSETVGRHLNAEFHFNRKFKPKSGPNEAGSWTRGVRPDYTISIWPSEYSKLEAEENELMVHVHFDAKYRVERVKELVGSDADDAEFESQIETKEDGRTAAKYADLLKMHAYRDAVRRTAGAYVLYPGSPGDDQVFSGFHEVLPGLGAFAVSPDSEGKAEGLGAVSDFLDQVVEHLANRTTARERLTYHASETYALRENPVHYGTLHLPESDAFGSAFRALPPAEEMVLVAWYESEAQLHLAESVEGFAYVRLGPRSGALHVQPNLARVRSVLLRTHGAVVAEGLLELREPGFRVYTRAKLRDLLQDRAHGAGVAAWQAAAGTDDEELIYAVFSTRKASTYAGRTWNGNKIMEEIERFETDTRHAPVTNVGRASPNPRILPLRDLLKALC